MSIERRWTFGVAALIALGAGAIVLLCRQVNVAAAEHDAKSWLDTNLDDRLGTLHELLYDRLERHVRDGVLHGDGELQAVVTSDGRVLASADPACHSALVELGSSLKQGRTRHIIECGRNLALAVAQQREDGAFTVLGYMLGQTWLRALERLAGTEVLLLDTEGVLLSSVRDERGGRAAVTLPKQLEQSVLRGERAFGQHRVRVDEYRGLGEEQIGRARGAMDVYALTAPLPGSARNSRVRLLMLLPVDRVLASALWATLLQAAGVMLLSFGCALLVALLQRKMTRPLVALQRATARVAEGDFTAEVPEIGKGESLRVARAFNAMVRRLREAGTRMLNVEKLASMGTLAAGVAHEINNPLSFVLSNLEYLEYELGQVALPPDQRERIAPALGDALEGAARVRAIVRDMRLFSGKADEARAPVDVRPVLESSLHLAESHIRHAARLVKDLREVPRVLASGQRLGQVFLNLIVNAAQAIKRGSSADDEIRVRTLFERGFVVVEVTDTGEGIPPENLPRLFDPFFTTKPVGEGTGLGLSICHGIIAALGGSIEVESKLGAGSTFRVLLPPAAPGAQPTITPAETPLLTPKVRAESSAV